jgi:hypothetical protein
VETFGLPPELEALEHVLACGPRPEPSAGLRRRVLGSLRSELHCEPTSRNWQFAATFAATVLLGLSLSLGVMQTTSLALQQSPPALSVDEVARRLQVLAPSLSREDSLRQAALRHIGAEASGPTTLGEVPSEGGLP